MVLINAIAWDTMEVVARVPRFIVLAKIWPYAMILMTDRPLVFLVLFPRSCAHRL